MAASDVVGLAMALAIPIVVAGLLSWGACGVYLQTARRLGWGQPVRADGPQAHLAKRGTPTMGGIAFMPVALLGPLVAVVATQKGWSNWANAVGAGIALAGLGMALIGFWDDATKIVGGKTGGVKARWRIIAQFAVAAAAVAVMHAIMHRPGVEQIAPTPTWLGAWPLGTVPSLVIRTLVIVGCVNAVNFTDGVDGLAAGTVAVAALGIAALPWALSPSVIMMPWLVGACLGFLIYNRHPAKLFMGDVGSCGLGGMLAAAAVALRIELVFFILGALFWLELASVMAQVISFQLTGKRILKMAPFHHHLELSGWSERKIVWAAYAAQAALTVATVAIVAKVTH